MVVANKCGKISPCMKAIGLMIKQMEEEDLFTMTGMFMKDIGKMIRQTGMECIYTKMDQHTVENGLRIFSTDLVNRNGQMGRHLKGKNINNVEITKMGKRMGMGSLLGGMDHVM